MVPSPCISHHLFLCIHDVLILDQGIAVAQQGQEGMEWSASLRVLFLSDHVFYVFWILALQHSQCGRANGGATHWLIPLLDGILGACTLKSVYVISFVWLCMGLDSMIWLLLAGHHVSAGNVLRSLLYALPKLWGSFAVTNVWSKFWSELLDGHLYLVLTVVVLILVYIRCGSEHL